MTINMTEPVGTGGEWASCHVASGCPPAGSQAAGETWQHCLQVEAPCDVNCHFTEMGVVPVSSDPGQLV